MIIDESFGHSSQAYELTRMHHAEGRIVRIRVHRDAYPQQSFAAAHVLTPVLTWTELAVAPASGWHHGTPPQARTGDVLAPIADRLLTRACAVLTRHTS